jgi:hypothetical protein
LPLSEKTKKLLAFIVGMTILILPCAWIYFDSSARLAKNNADNQSSVTAKPDHMSVFVYNQCDYKIHAMVWVDGSLVGNYYIGTGTLDGSTSMSYYHASNSKVTISFCVAQYGVWSSTWSIPQTYNNGDICSISCEPDLTVTYWNGI